MRLICVSPYRSRGASYQPGEVIDLPEAEARALLADSPGSFALPQDVGPTTTTPPIIADGAPANTAMRRAPRRKGS